MNFDYACILSPVLLYTVGFVFVSVVMYDKRDPSGSGMLLLGYGMLSPFVLLLSTVITIGVAVKNNLA